ncbi:formylglycine-generating enzyme family protein [Jeongeupia sp. USM3]|uniref:formylglycine-generating enzyme family protein n=1 Tax=Jeongeupia sp. USM3 TaxID=1906741 RepID=UPI00089E0917|nr:formylglycine-generating enzyme family protein [Jeongeupia sp. USM3]AOY00759.1 sulfatase-modifying factor 1 [Jeongeupia sp. USM3]
MPASLQRYPGKLAFAVLAIVAGAAGAADCRRASGLPEGWGRDAHAGMVRIAGGSFTPGSTAGYADERPAGAVRVKPFWIDRTEVTNAQFAAFARATGYVTDAERAGAAAVFKVPPEAELNARPYAWWVYTKGADWRHPEGPGSTIGGRENQPVVQVTQADAFAYARWLGRTLPTEAQWEYAARAGRSDAALDRAPRDKAGKPGANFWQGVFPSLNTREDGHLGRAPVACFPANGFGLHDMIGNVWEWTRDAYTGPRQPHGNGDPFASVGTMPLQPGTPALIKGGSFLCAANFCVRYRAAARHPQEANLPTAHVGFRTVSAD